jgi:hypothetical protein
LALTLALTRLRELSTLEEDSERLKLDAWFVLMLALTAFRALSTLDEEFERLKLDA